MGLKCSVLGHAYGETTVERDREERGSEVVITIRELETCDRCGDTRVVTENKEVTTIEAPGREPDVTAADAMSAMDDEAADAGGRGDVGTDDVGTGDGVTDDVGIAETTGPSTEEVPPAGEDDAEVMVDDAEGGAAVTAEEEPATETASSDASTVEDQGAEILDADATTAEDDAVDDELADPTIENDADVPGDSSEDEDAVILEDEPTDVDASDQDQAGDAGASDSEDDADSGRETFGGATATADDEAGPFDPPANDDDDDPLGEWPEETLRDDEDSWTPTEDLTGTVGDVDPDSDVDREFSTDSAVTVPEGEFHCEECGYTTAVEASSLRAGDFCPECRTETLIHRPEE